MDFHSSVIFCGPCLHLNRNHFNMVLHYFPLKKKKQFERLVLVAQMPFDIHLLIERLNKVVVEIVLGCVNGLNLMVTVICLA